MLMYGMHRSCIGRTGRTARMVGCTCVGVFLRICLFVVFGAFSCNIATFVRIALLVLGARGVGGFLRAGGAYRKP